MPRLGRIARRGASTPSFGFLGLVHLHHAELALPEMEGLLAYLLLTAHV